MGPTVKPHTLLSEDDFHFSSMERTEDITRYAPGGYHPIIIGDILISKSDPTSDSSSYRQYRIVHKLGFGSYSTVWLAQKTSDSSHDETTFVAVKVTTAEEEYVDHMKEATMIKATSMAPTHESGGRHALALLDQFTLHGPNGIHAVLVTDVIAPILSLLTPKCLPSWRKAAAHGLAQAVAQLHGAGIVHGDMHLGNVGLAFPQLADQDPDDVMQDLDPYEITVVLPISAQNQTPSLPAYVVAPCNLARYYDRIVPSDVPPQMKIFDFGSAHEVGSLPLSFQCAVEAAAPELAFARAIEKTDNPPVEPPADVWALGSAIYELVTGSSLFHGVGMKGLPHNMVVLAGSVPPGWQNWYAALPNPPQVSPGSADLWWASRREMIRRNCADDADADVLITLLRKILVLDPTKRMAAAEVLQDLWFLRTAA